jgi:transcriptional regulator with XRE-family HTH domain
MPELSSLSILSDILRAAKARGLSQKTLAGRAGISEESLSRMKKRGSTRVDILSRLASAVGISIVSVSAGTAAALRPPVVGDSTAPLASVVELRPLHPPSTIDETPPRSRAPRSFRERHPELAWSNSKASDEVYIRGALLEPRFHTLLDAAKTFGLAQLDREWALLAAEASPQARRAAVTTERTLRNLHNGYEQAARANAHGVGKT